MGKEGVPTPKEGGLSYTPSPSCLPPHKVCPETHRFLDRAPPRQTTSLAKKRKANRKRAGPVYCACFPSELRLGEDYPRGGSTTPSSLFLHLTRAQDPRLDEAMV